MAKIRLGQKEETFYEKLGLKALHLQIKEDEYGEIQEGKLWRYCCDDEEMLLEIETSPNGITAVCAYEGFFFVGKVLYVYFLADYSETSELENYLYFENEKGEAIRVPV